MPLSEEISVPAPGKGDAGGKASLEAAQQRLSCSCWCFPDRGCGCVSPCCPLGSGADQLQLWLQCFGQLTGAAFSVHTYKSLWAQHICVPCRSQRIYALGWAGEHKQIICMHPQKKPASRLPDVDDSNSIFAPMCTDGKRKRTGTGEVSPGGGFGNQLYRKEKQFQRFSSIVICSTEQNGCFHHVGCLPGRIPFLPQYTKPAYYFCTNGGKLEFILEETAYYSLQKGHLQRVKCHCEGHTCTGGVT